MSRIPKPPLQTVYTLDADQDYEGSYIYGVFSSVAAAQKYGKEHLKIRWRGPNDTVVNCIGGQYVIREHYIDHPELDPNNP